jgi:hypothetical protein
VKTASRSASVLILAANAGLAAGFLEVSEPIGLLAAIALAALWSFGLYKKRAWTADLGLFFLYALVALQAYVRVSALWLLLSGFSGLAAWDLCHFVARFSTVEPSEMALRIQQKHLIRLSFASAVSFLLVLVALNLQFRLTFGWALVLGIILLLALNQIIALIRRQGE